MAEVVNVHSGETRHLAGDGTPPAKSPRSLSRRERVAAWVVAGIFGAAVAVPALLAVFYASAWVSAKIIRAIAGLW